MSQWLVAFAPVIALSVNVLSQVACFRTLRARGLLRSLFAGFGAGLPAVIILTLAVLHRHPISALDAAALILLNLLTYGALAYGFFHFVNLGETARRVRLLRELVEAGGELSEEDLLRRYNAQDIVRLRLDRLKANQQLVTRNGRHVIARPTVLAISRLILAMKRLVLRSERTDKGRMP